MPLNKEAVCLHKLLHIRILKFYLIAESTYFQKCFLQFSYGAK